MKWSEVRPGFAFFAAWNATFHTLVSVGSQESDDFIELWWIVARNGVSTLEQDYRIAYGSVWNMDDAQTIDEIVSRGRKYRIG